MTSNRSAIHRKLRACKLLCGLVWLGWVSGCGSEPADKAPTTTGTVIEAQAGETARGKVGPSGGTVALADGSFRLEIPAGALASETEIALTPLLVDGQRIAIRMEPAGTTFATPAVAVEKVPGGTAPRTRVAILMSESGTPQAAPWLDPVVLPDGTLETRAQVQHFSLLLAFQNSDVGVVEAEQLAGPSPWQRRVGTTFFNPVRFRLATRTSGALYAVHDSKTGKYPNIGGTLRSTGDLVIRTSHAFTFQVVHATPDLEDLKLPLSETQSPVIAHGYHCPNTSSGTIRNVERIAGAFSLELTGYKTDSAPTPGNIYLKPGETKPIPIPDVLYHSPTTDVQCIDSGSVSKALQLLAADAKAVLPRHKAAWLGECTKLSNNASCEIPKLAQAIGAVLDPVLTLGPNAVQRLEAAFPCGDGPNGHTVCAPGAKFSEGDWVWLQQGLHDDVPLADPKGTFQHAFVFDADGIPTNNYVPAPKFPGDFFAGTDKWYELLYAPGAGWSAKIRDVRKGLAVVPSMARFVISGRDIALFLPRAELDGASPSFRASAFRHEGDYGLQGGPWSGSYFPALTAPLLPAASGASIGVPE